MTKYVVATECLYVPCRLALVAYGVIKALDKAECDGGEGEYDAPAEVALKKQFPNNTIIEWECLAVHAKRHFVVFEDVRIVFKVEE